MKLTLTYILGTNKLLEPTFYKINQQPLRTKNILFAKLY